MKNFSRIISLVEFAVIALFISNVWIFSYIKILKLLNKAFLPSSPAGFIRFEVAPEPFEIPLFIGLTFLFTIIIFILNKPVFLLAAIKIKSTVSNRYYQLLLFVSLPLLAIIFLANLGNYPMAHDIYPYVIQDNRSIIFFFTSFYIAICLFVFLVSPLLSLLIKKRKLLFYFFLASVFLFIAFLTFEPRFPIYGHDYSYFLGPIWEIIQGKTIFTDIVSQYGFGSILLLATLFKLNLLNIWQLPIVIWFLYIFEYFLSFLLLFKISKSTIFSLVGLLSILTVNYFSLYHVPSVIPQIGPIRWLPLLLFLFLFSLAKKIDSNQIIVLLSWLAFWVIDSGIYLLLAYFFTIFLLILADKLKLQKAVKTVGKTLLTISFVFLLINILHLVLGYKTINVYLIFSKLRQYAGAGFGMIPIQEHSFFWLVILLYIASIVYFFRTNNAKTGRDLSLLVFSANLSLLASVYFVGRSHPHNLFNIAIFLLLNAFILLSELYKKITSKKIKIVFLTSLFLIFIAFPVFQRQEIITKNIVDRLRRIRSGNIFKPEFYEILKQKYGNDLKLIKSLKDEKIIILSDDDTYLFYLSNKKNLLDDNSQATVLTYQDIDRSTQNAVRACPKKIIADCALVKSCQNSDPLTITYFAVQPLILQKIETSCRKKYKPTICADHLCILQTDTLR